MARLLLQMMMSLDGMVSGPKGALDWTPPFVGDEKLLRDSRYRNGALRRDADPLIRSTPT